MKSLIFVLFLAGAFSSIGWTEQENATHNSAHSASFTFRQRVGYKRSIEEVYWRNRIWPAENKTPKPPLDKTMPETKIQKEVRDYLQKTAALERFWHRRVTAEQLQAEMNRMIRGTQNKAVLKQIFTALDNNPQAIAECLARPAIVDRLIRNMYAWDERFHGPLRARAENELSAANTVDSARAMSGVYREISWKRKSSEDYPDTSHPTPSLELDDLEWDSMLESLQLQLAVGQTDTRRKFPGELPLRRFGALQQDPNRFYAIAILERKDDEVRIGKVEWEKETFEKWWAMVGPLLRPEIETPISEYRIQQPDDEPSCVNDSWSATFAPAPAGRSLHTAVWTGSEMIVWGGQGSGSSWLNTGGRYDPATDTWAAGGTSTLNAPAPRYFHTAVWTGTEMIVWGGINGTNTGGRYNPATDSWAPGGTSIANAPTGRYLHTAVWSGNEMIVWGGTNGAVPKPITGGRYDPATDTWIPRGTSTLNAPTGRSRHTAVWTGSEMIIWGGVGDGGSESSGGRYNPESDKWAAEGIALSGSPSMRYDHSAVWTGSLMIVWGGNGNTGGLYLPAMNQWIAGGTSTIGAPSGRWSHTAIWTGSEMIVWGGSDINGALNTGGRYTPSTNQWAVGGTSILNAPSRRGSHTSVWTDTEMIVWGGNGNTGGRYDPSTNQWLAGGTDTGNSPSGRYSHGAVWTGAEMIIWGGYDGIGWLGTGGRYDPATDTWAVTGNTNAPEGRERHTAIWTGAEMIVWGGYNGASHLSTGGRYDPATNEWAPGGTSAVNAPSERNAHTAIWTGSEMVVWGGYNGSLLDTGGRYDPLTGQWAIGGTTTSGAPEMRVNHTAVWTGSEMIIWGGDGNGFSPRNTGGRYIPSTDTWAVDEISLVNAPEPRREHTAVWTGSEMIVWGGYATTFPYMNSGGRYNPVDNSWSPGGTSQVNSPQGRIQHTTIWSGSEMIVWGGSVGSGDDRTGGRYSPVTDSWKPGGISAINAPERRWEHTAVWAGVEMILWGGNSGPWPYSDTGSRYCAVNNAPIATEDFYLTNMDVPLTVEAPGVLFNDTDLDGDPLTVALIDAPIFGTLAIETDGSFIYTPDSNFKGTDTFTYHVHDGNVFSNIATVTIDVRCLFCDDFDDNLLAQNWTYSKAAWTEIGGKLLGTPVNRKTTAVASPAFSGCQNCYVSTTMRISGGLQSSVSIYGWYLDKSTLVELVLKEETDKIILKQRVNKSIVGKKAASFVIEPDVDYAVIIEFDGAFLTVSIDTTVLVAMAPGAPIPVGTVGFSVKNTTGAFELVDVN